MPYCPDLFNYHRRRSTTVQIGSLRMGGDEPVRVQSMANTSTMDTEGCVAQCLRMVEAGAELVRFTAQGEREAANLANIKKALREQGCEVPLVADIHFNPKAADEAALHVEKVRINPGNYVDSVKTFRHFEYTEDEYAQELKKIRDRFLPFLERCRVQRTAIRIGVNHGSLSDRIMSRYGDTAAGMVESCMEFLRLCVESGFFNVVISIKASNTLVMVQTVRLLVERMDAEDMHFPLHLGVTEAGDGEDGRIKSAVGIGTLLMDGIGDTIRVSLSEDPERELPVAKRLVEMVQERSTVVTDGSRPFLLFDPFTYQRRKTVPIGAFGGNQVPVVLIGANAYKETKQDQKPDYYCQVDEFTNRWMLVDGSDGSGIGTRFPVIGLDELDVSHQATTSFSFVRITPEEVNTVSLQRLNAADNVVLLLMGKSLGQRRAFFHALMHAGCSLPVILCVEESYSSIEDLQLGLSLDVGPLLLDGFGDGLLFLPTSDTTIAPDDITRVLFGILQATRLRISKTEYISCPGCGRTLFDLQRTIASIKSRTDHLKGLKIGIMGCIVNGPGEMADADYGYVGAGRGRVSLYKGQSCVERNIPEDQAVDKLIALIKQYGDWKERGNGNT